MNKRNPLDKHHEFPYVFRPKDSRKAREVTTALREYLTAICKVPHAPPESVKIIRSFLHSRASKPTALPLTWWVTREQWKHISRAARAWDSATVERGESLPYPYQQLLQARQNGKRWWERENRKRYRAEQAKSLSQQHSDPRQIDYPEDSDIDTRYQ